MTTNSTPVAAGSSNKKINDACGRIRKNAANLNTLIHSTGLMVLEHTRLYSDCTGAARLVNAMPKSHRRALVVNWFEKYSPIVITIKNGDASAHIAKEGSAKHKKFNRQGAEAEPFYEMKEVDNEPDLFTVEDALKSVDNLAARLKRIAKGEGKTEASPADVARINALANMLALVKVPDVLEPEAANADVDLPVAKVA